MSIDYENHPFMKYDSVNVVDKETQEVLEIDFKGLLSAFQNLSYVPSIKHINKDDMYDLTKVPEVLQDMLDNQTTLQNHITLCANQAEQALALPPQVDKAEDDDFDDIPF